MRKQWVIIYLYKTVKVHYIDVNKLRLSRTLVGMERVFLIKKNTPPRKKI